MSAAEWIAKGREHAGRSQEMRARYPRALDALEAVLAELGPHYRAQVAREAKFGRVGSACVCDACKAVHAIEAALEGKS